MSTSKLCRSWVAVAATAAALITSVVASPPPAAIAASGDDGRGSLPPPLPDPQLLVQNLASTTYSSIYGGMTASADNASLTIYLTQLDPVAEAALRAVAPTLSLSFAPTSNTLATLDSMMEQLRHQQAALVAAGTNLTTWGPNEQTGKLDIGVLNMTPADVQVFESMFGADNVNVYNQTADDIAKRRDQTRTNDTAPYYGGDAIANGVENKFCTSGWGITINGNPRLLTAGHCYLGTGDKVVNAKLSTSNTVVGSENPMGEVTQNAHNSTDQLDAEVFTGCNGTGTCGGTTAIWTEANGSPLLRPVGGVGGWSVGNVVCSSGAYGYTNCDLKVTAVNFCGPTESGTMCHLTSTDATTNGNTTQPGDSGCPIFRVTNGYAYALGINQGGDGWSYEQFTGINSALGQFGASLIKAL
jgi:V8-like Glu-specific endopeptidase